jgi:predicted metal-binding protein
LGVSGARIVDATRIVVEDALARMCERPRCPSYGLSASCPPHVGGPEVFRALIEGYRHALVLKTDVPTEILLSEQRREVYRLNHEIAAAVEIKAVELGFPRARAFAGGACKDLFCNDEPDCAVLTGGACRNPDKARQSMSGYGVNVSELVQSAGWTMQRITSGTETGLAVGLVLVG